VRLRQCPPLHHVWIGLDVGGDDGLAQMRGASAAVRVSSMPIEAASSSTSFAAPTT
jgi:hypothetical protein